MRKIIVILAALVVAINADAQIKLGIKTGLNVSDMSFSGKDGIGGSIDNMYANRNGWHLGLAMKVNLPFHLVLQPELLFSTKNFNIENQTDHSTSKYILNYIEIPVNLQWGFSIGKIRPYAEVSPYFSYMIGSNKPLSTLNSWDGGVGLGVGIDLWKLQISGKYVWGLKSDIGDIEGFKDVSFNNRSIQISLGFFL
jgi:hypothetical protein